MNSNCISSPAVQPSAVLQCAVAQHDHGNPYSEVILQVQCCKKEQDGMTQTTGKTCPCHSSRGYQEFLSSHFTHGLTTVSYCFELLFVNTTEKTVDEVTTAVPFKPS